MILLSFPFMDVVIPVNTYMSYLIQVADVMSKWDKYQAAGGTLSRQSKHHMFLFKKHLFLDEYIDIRDPVEKELLYYQVNYIPVWLRN